MCGICSRLGVNVHTDDFSLETPQDFSLDPFAGGTYKRTATSPPKPIASLDRVIQQIDSGNVLKAPNGVFTYTFLDKSHLTGLYNNPNAGFTAAFGLSSFSNDQRAAARESIQFWDDLVPQSFRESNGMGADIVFANSLDPGQAYAYYPGKKGWKFQSDVFVADPNDPVNGNWTNKWFTPGGYGNTTLIHEIGHTLGLSHPGAYNGAAATTYDGMAEYAQDSMQYSIMSYWSGSSTGALTVNWSTLLNNFAQTPMVHDILTIQAKYGADPTTRTGDTTYGFNSNAGRDIYDFNKNPYPYLAIYDAGGSNDTIDLSGFTASQFVNLQPGSFSSVGAAAASAAAVNANRDALLANGAPDFGDVTQASVDATAASFMNAAAARISAFTGVAGIAATAHDNLAIAYGTIIENAIGGSARDLLWGNSADNRLEGRGGNDVLDGWQGADTLWGGLGNDVFQFRFVEKGDRIMDWNAGDRIDLTRIDAVAGSAANDAFTWIAGAAFSGVAGQLRYANGLLAGDVNGDGVADFELTVVGSPALAAADILF